jgi:hypothetical protein
MTNGRENSSHGSKEESQEESEEALRLFRQRKKGDAKSVPLVFLAQGREAAPAVPAAKRLISI